MYFYLFYVSFENMLFLITITRRIRIIGQNYILRFLYYMCGTLYIKFCNSLQINFKHALPCLIVDYVRFEIMIIFGI